MGRERRRGSSDDDCGDEAPSWWPKARWSSATLAAAVMTPAGASTSHTITIKTAQVPEVGLVLTTNAGLTLYHLTSDPTGTSTCTGPCAQIWLPLLLPKGDHLQGPRWPEGALDDPRGARTPAGGLPRRGALPLHRRHEAGSGQGAGDRGHVVRRSQERHTGCRPPLDPGASPPATTTPPSTPGTTPATTPTPSPATTPPTMTPSTQPPTTQPPTTQPPNTTPATTSPGTGGAGF